MTLNEVRVLKLIRDNGALFRFENGYSAQKEAGRDRTLTALHRKGLIADTHPHMKWVITEHGREVLRELAS